MSTRLGTLLASAAAILSTTAIPAVADAPSGTVVAVIQSADATGGPSGRRMLSVADAIFMGDVIKTGSIGEAQLRFRDQTKLVVGPNSSLKIDAFVFDNSRTARKVSINAARGTFRFITGASPKSAYSLNTPTATIGVRGTEFDFSVGRNGATTLVLYGGSAKLCSRNGSCVEMRGGCGIAVVPPNGPARKVTSLRERRSILDSNFPYLQRQAGLQRGFRTDVSNCSVQKAFVPDGGGSNAVPVQRADASPPTVSSPPAPPAASPPPSPTVSPPTPSAPQPSGNSCGGNCGNGNGGGGGNGTGNEGRGQGQGASNGRGNSGN